MRVSVVGLGKLGAPIVAVFAAKGYDVVGIDTNPAFVEKINNHIAPVEEPGLQELLTEHKARISATRDWSKAIGETEMTTVIVPTPSGADGAFRNDYVLSVMDDVGRALAKKSGYHLVVVHSTTMPGSVGGPIRERLEHASGRKVGRDLGLCYNPEFIALGDVINGLLHPDFILIGESDKKAGDLLEGIYRKVVGPHANIARMNFVNAELTKISVNTYVTMKISFANMLGEICDRLQGADVSVVADAIGRDTRIGKKYLKPAIGYGGPCFPRDTIAFGRVAHLVGGKADLALATDVINRRQVQRLTETIRRSDSEPASWRCLACPTSRTRRSSRSRRASCWPRRSLMKGFEVVAHDPMALGPAQAVLGATVKLVPSARGGCKPGGRRRNHHALGGLRGYFARMGRGRTHPLYHRLLAPARSGSIPEHCKIVRLGHQETISAAAKRVAAE